ncbi:unnamed protein product [Boreogadus saida]
MHMHRLASGLHWTQKPERRPGRANLVKPGWTSMLQNILAHPNARQTLPDGSPADKTLRAKRNGRAFGGPPELWVKGWPFVCHRQGEEEGERGGG